jgi:hypothetical protein
MPVKKHRVSNLKLREISSVDRPAQVGAVSVLMKRRSADAVEELIKATFQEALTGCLLADKVRDVFYTSFENMYDGKEAFRKALIDELAAGGDGSTASQAFKDWLSTLVDQATGAAKAAGAANVPDELNKAFTQAADEWLGKQEHDMKITNRADLTAAITKFQADGDKATVADAVAIRKAAGELKAEDALPAEGPLAPVATVDPTLADKVERMEKRDALSVDLRKHYDGLSTDTDRDAFLKLDADGQAAALAKAGGDDPVVYTTLDGVDIRKSADPALLAMAKGRDSDRRELAKVRASEEDTRLEKRAGDELGNVGGDLVGKKALLKAVDDIADAPTKDAALAVLKAANTSSKGVFVRKGAGEGNTGPVETNDGYEMGEAEAKLDELAKARAKEGNISFEKAYTEVIQTSEGSALYKRYTDGDE